MLSSCVLEFIYHRAFTCVACWRKGLCLDLWIRLPAFVYVKKLAVLVYFTESLSALDVLSFRTQYA